MKKQNVIELNGKYYDALTGAYIGEIKDGFADDAVPAVVHQPVAIEKPATVLAVVADRASKGHSPTHHAAHRPQQTKTLMRHVVKAPHKTSKTAIKSQAPITGKLTGSIVAPTVQSATDNDRTQRSQDVNRSHMVQRFQAVDPTESVTQTMPQAALKKTYLNPGLKPKKLQPTQAIRPDIIAAPKQNSKKAPVATVAIPSAAALKVAPPMVLTPSTPQPIRPQPLSLKNARRATIPVRQPFLPKNIPAPAEIETIARPEQDIFEQALARANSHHQKPPKESLLRSLRRRKKNRQATSIAASAAVFLLLLGFITYQNKANIQIQMASAKAGFSVSDPGYKPEGFAMKKITYSSGTAASWYTDGERNFSVVQKKSNWDSQSLLENFVATSNQQYQGYEANGRTVYIYGDGKATWVNGGVWYQVQAGNTLSNDQLIKVAASM